MAQNDLLRRYLEAGMAFTAMTQARAEAIVKDLVKAGEVQADQAREMASELLERSRRNTDRLVDTIRKEVRSQIDGLDVVRRNELARLEQRISSLTGRLSSSSSTTTAKKSTAKKSTAKKSAAKKSTAKKSTAKRTAAKKTAAKKTAAKKTTAKRSTAKKTAAKKSTAKKSASGSS